MKKNKGITLIALVVTVIVLLIIAGISISTLKGDRGLIKLTKQAKVDTENANNAEKLEIEKIFNELEYGEDLTDEELKEKKDEIIDSLNEQVKGLENQVKELGQKNGELNDKNSELRKQVESLGVDIENLREQIEGLNGQVADLKTEVANLKDQITQKDKEIEDLNGEIAGKDKDIEAKNKEIADLKKQVQEKQNKIDELQEQIDDINSILGETTAGEEQILLGYKAYSKGRLLTGTMPNNGALNKTLSAGSSFKIPAGYTTGGTVEAKDLASQTVGTATAADIAKDKTAWVNGIEITGTKVPNVSTVESKLVNNVHTATTTFDVEPNGRYLIIAVCVNTKNNSVGHSNTQFSVSPSSFQGLVGYNLIESCGVCTFWREGFFVAQGNSVTVSICPFSTGSDVFWNVRFDLIKIS